MKKKYSVLSDYRLYTEEDVLRNAKVRKLSDGTVKVTAFRKGVYHKSGFERLEMFSRYEAEASSRKVGSCEAEKALKEAQKGASELPEVLTRSDNIKRAKDKIFEISSANKWDYMVTLTLDKEKINRYDKSEVQKLVSKWCDNQVQRKGFKYLLVPEYHEDGAIHFHGLCNDALDFVFAERYKIKGRKKPVALSTLKKYGFRPDSAEVQQVFNLNDFPFGFSTAVRLDGNVIAVSMYMTKYITKDLKKIFGSFYIAGGKIQRSLPFELMDIDFNSLEKMQGAKKYDLPDNYGQVIYLYTTYEELMKGAIIYA